MLEFIWQTIVSSLETMVYVEIGCSLATIELCNRRKDSMFFFKKPKTYGQLASPLPKFTCKKVE